MHTVTKDISRKSILCAAADPLPSDRQHGAVEKAPKKIMPRQVGMTAGTDHSQIILYFSRVGNTVFDSDVDAVSSASTLLDKNGKRLDSAQMVAEWIQGETGGDLFPIQTYYTYPSDFGDTIEVIVGQDKDDRTLAMAALPENMEQYDTVWLVYPIWDYTICTPVRSFLQQADLSGKTVYAVSTHCGSGFADSIERMKGYQPDAEIVRAVSVSADNTEDHRDEVVEYARSVKKEKAKSGNHDNSFSPYSGF